MAKGGMCGEEGAPMARGHACRAACLAGEHAWQGGMCGYGLCGREGVCSRVHAWQGACMIGGMHDWGHVWWGCEWKGACMAHMLPWPDTMRYGWSMCGRYAS